MTHGLFEWVDVSVPDMDRGAEFYRQLFGWTSEPSPGTDGSDYLLFRRDGKLAAGIVLSRTGRTGWNSYATVDSAEQIAVRAAELGATVAVEPMDVGTAGRMTWIVDPQGAEVGFWEPGDHRGAEAYNEPGFLTWNEVRTRDHDGSRAFYEALMPEWSFHPLEMEQGFYTMIKLGDRDNSAIAPLNPEHFDEGGARWAVWFTVADAAADAERIEGLGGSVLGPVVDTSYGPAVRVADPFGSAFLIIGPMQAPEE
jgi:predicted enzyme related to lactoylglutathione lyase